MSAVKIKIECDDPLLAATLASAIDRSLSGEGFTNLKAKVMMVYHDSSFKISEVREFLKRDAITNSLYPRPDARQDLYMHELLPTGPFIDTIPPSLAVHLREKSPEAFAFPIVIDMGISPPEGAEIQAEETYQQQEDAFLKGE